MKAPCMECKERHFKCHSECEKYIEFTEYNKKIYENRNKDKSKWTILTGTATKVIRERRLAKF